MPMLQYPVGCWLLRILENLELWTEPTVMATRNVGDTAIGTRTQTQIQATFENYQLSNFFHMEVQQLDDVMRVHDFELPIYYLMTV